MSDARCHLVLLGEAAPEVLVLCQKRPEFADWLLDAVSSPEHAQIEAELPANTKLLLLSPKHVSATPAAMAIDEAFRGLLLRRGDAHSVVHADDDGWMNGVLRACRYANRPEHQTLRRWACDACSDPDCEHRLFQDLLARRPG